MYIITTQTCNIYACRFHIARKYIQNLSITRYFLYLTREQAAVSQQTCTRAAHGETARVENVHSHFEATSNFTKNIFHWHWGVVKVNLGGWYNKHII